MWSFLQYVTLRSRTSALIAKVLFPFTLDTATRRIERTIVDSLLFVFLTSQDVLSAIFSCFSKCQ